MKAPFLYRRLGDAAILFNERTWKTHVLTPAASIIYESLLGHFGEIPIPIQDAIVFLEDDLALDPNSADIKEMLSMLDHLGIIAAYPA